jgi:tRNA (guanine37-N1)-methyltransferase
MKVPDVLLSGNHAKIEKWRKRESLKRTWLRRPELLNNLDLDKEEEKLLEEIKKNY